MKTTEEESERNQTDGEEDGKRNWTESVTEPGCDVDCETKVFVLCYQLTSTKQNTCNHYISSNDYT